MQFSIDPYRLEDEAFIRDSWKESFKFSKEGRVLPQTAYYLWQTARIDRVFDRSPLIYVARIRYAPDIEKIVGWIVAEELANAAIIHYVYVKSTHRRAKIATRLLAKVLPHLGSHQLYYTHGTWAQKIAERKGLRFMHLETALHAA